MLNVVCVRWGNKYGPEYVDRLYKMVDKNLSIPFQFDCYEGQDDGLEDWWPKLRLFESGRYNGRCLYFDLDVVIQRNIDHLLDYKGFRVIDTTWLQKPAIGINSSCMLWDDNSHVWEYFWKDPEYYMTKYEGIDGFMVGEGLIKEKFPKGIFYSIFHGSDKNDKLKLQPPWYHLKDHDVCVLHGMHKLTPKDFKWANPYSELKRYYEEA